MSGEMILGMAVGLASIRARDPLLVPDSFFREYVDWGRAELRRETRREAAARRTEANKARVRLYFHRLNRVGVAAVSQAPAGVSDRMLVWLRRAFR